MHHGLRISGMALAALTTLALLAGCDNSANRKTRIGVSIPAASHGWTGGVVWSAEETKKALEKEYPDVEVIIATAGNSAEQVDRIENLLARRPDALVVMSQEPGPITPVCANAKQQGTYLVVVSNPLTQPVSDLFVNGDNRSFGAAAAEAMGQLLGGQGDIVVMEGIPCPVNTDRVEAFRETLRAKYPKIRILDSQTAMWTAEKGLALMENFLQKYPQIDGVWAGDDDVLIGVLQAYHESKRTDVKAMVGGGGSKVMVKKVLDRDPLVRATVTYSPRMIETAIREALAGLRNGKKPLTGPEKIISSEIVTPENAAQHYFPNSVY